MLEGGLGGDQEAIQVVVYSTLRLVPQLVESGVVVRTRFTILIREVPESSSAVALDFGTKGIS